MIGTIACFLFAFPMPRILFSLLFLVFLIQCGKADHFPKDTYSFDRINLSHLPDRIPAAIPRSFLPSQVTFIDSTELRSGFSNPRESYLLLESDLGSDEIKKTLEKRSSLGDWKLLQKDEDGNKTSYLFEGFIKKSLSVLVIDTGNKRVLKYYFKKQSTY
jgi:hypothetical protein